MATSSLATTTGVTYITGSVGSFTGSGSISGTEFLVNGPEGSATSLRSILKKVTGIADAVATAVLTVTVPNGNHAALIRLTMMGSNGSTDAWESATCQFGAIVVTRVSGGDTATTGPTLFGTAQATVASGATHTFAYAVSSITGASNATQTFTVNVTINDSGNVGGNQCLFLAELINSNASGISMA